MELDHSAIDNEGGDRDCLYGYHVYQIPRQIIPIVKVT